MADPIQIKLQARGVQEVMSSFRTVEQAILQLETRMSRAAARGGSERISLSQKEAAEKEKAFAKLAKDAEKWQREDIRGVEKAERAKLAEAERSARAMARIRENSATMAGRYAIQQADKEIAEAKRTAETRAHFARAIGGATMSGVSGAAHGIVGTARGLGASAMSIGGGFGIADSVQRELKLTGIAGNIAASGNADPDGKKWKTAEILSRARGSARPLGMDTEEMLGGIEAFKKLTGNTGRALALAPEMGKLAVATGTNMKDMMSNAGNISLSDPKMSNADVMKLAMVQTKQGMTGAVEMSDLAKYGGRLTAAASLYGGDRSKNIAMMGAFAQLGRSEGGAASAAEAAMAAQRFSTDVQKHSKGLRKMGIEVGDGKGGLRAADEIVKAMVEKTSGDVTKFGAMGLGERGVKVLTAVSNEYRSASGGTRQKGESDADYAVRHKRGMDAVDKTLATFTGGMSDKDVDSSLKERLADADKQVEKVMLELRDAVGSQLLPEFVKLVPVLRDLTPMVADVLREGTKFAEWFASNPLKGIGSVISIAIAKEIASSMIAKGMEQALSSAIGQKMGSGGLIVGTAAVAIAAGMITIDKLADDLNKGRNKSLATSNEAFVEAKGIEGKVRDGTATKEDLAKLNVLRTQMEEQVKTETDNKGNKSTLETLGQLVTAPAEVGQKLGGNETVSEQYQKSRDEELRQSKEALDELNKAIAIAAKGLAELGKTAGTPGPASPAGTPASANAPSTTLPLHARP